MTRFTSSLKPSFFVKGWVKGLQKWPSSAPRDFAKSSEYNGSEWCVCRGAFSIVGNFLRAFFVSDDCSTAAAAFRMRRFSFLPVSLLPNLHLCIFLNPFQARLPFACFYALDRVFDSISSLLHQKVLCFFFSMFFSWVFRTVKVNSLNSL